MPSPRVRLTVTALLTALWFLGCSEGEAGSMDAGSTEAGAPTLIVGSDPVLRVADADPSNPSPIGFATWASRLPDGGVVVLDHHSPGMHLFSPGGAHLRSVVRRGEGPGEFVGPRWASSCGSEELLVWDNSRRTMLVFTPDGDFIREFRLEGEPHEPRCSSAGRLAILGMPERLLPLSPSGERSPAPIWTVEDDGSIRDVLAIVPHTDPRALGKSSRIAVSSDLVFIGDAESSAVATFRLDDGSPADSVFIGIDGRASTAEDYRLVIEYFANFMLSERGREAQRERHSGVPRPETLPPFRDLFASPSGVLWAVLSPLGAPRTDLQPHLPGTGVGAVSSVPFSFRVTEVGDDFVLGVAEKEFGMQEVLVLPLASP